MRLHRAHTPRIPDPASRTRNLTNFNEELYQTDQLIVIFVASMYVDNCIIIENTAKTHITGNKRNENMKEFKNLKVDLSDGVALVTINRPEALNALNSAFFTEFNDLLNIISKDDTIRVMVITGEGKAFVAGADIAEMSHMNSDQGCCFSQTGQKTFLKLEKMEIPVIAAINGFALGGGFELAQACDFRIAASTAKFGQPEVTLGLIPGYAGTQRLSRMSGMGNALYLILSGEMITAEDAMKMGLVQKVVPPETLMEEVMKMAKKMAANGSNAIRMAKEVIRKGLEIPLKEGSHLEAAAFSKLFDYPSTKEGMTAFLEKRKPKW